MAEQSPIQFEDIPLAEARTMSRGPRMDPELYQTLKGKIQTLDNTATRVTLPGLNLAKGSFPAKSCRSGAKIGRQSAYQTGRKLTQWRSGQQESAQK
jgi:hypothetical protein